MFGESLRMFNVMGSCPSSRLLEKLLALYRAAPQHPPFGCRKIGACMAGTPVVPHHQVAGLPFVLVNEVAVVGEREQFVEHFAALGVGHVFDARGDKGVHKARGAPLPGA